MEKKTLDELLDFLAKDEEEAIEGYEDVIKQIGEDNPLVPELRKIIDEEIAHKKFVEEAKKNPNLKYEDPAHDERKKASELWKTNL